MGLLLLASLAGTSCGTSRAELPPAAAGRGTPQRGGALRLTFEAPHCLDPAEVDSVYESLPVGQIFSGLVALDPGLNVVPALADTWTISRDGRIYTFHLRQGVRFHDGTALTAEDVAFTIRRLLAPSRPKRSIGASYLLVVQGAQAFMAGRAHDLPGVVVVDPSRVEIRLERPYLSFLEVLAMVDLRIVPQRALQSAGEAAFRRRPIGTGPFRFESMSKTELRLTANREYYAGAPFLDEVVIRFPDTQERDNGNGRFMRRETDIVEPSPDLLDAMQKDPTIAFHRYQELSLSFLGFQTGIPVIADERVRRAIAHAIDRKALAELSSVTRREATGILPPGLPGYSPAPKALDYDPAESRRLLAEAGHPGGRGIPPIVTFVAIAGNRTLSKTYETLRLELAAVGLTLVVREVSWPELNARIEEATAPAFQLGWVADLPDPDSFLRTLFEPGGSANYFGFLDAATARSLERGAQETNPLERARIYRELERSILDKAPLIPLFHTVGMIASRTTVHGFKPGPMGIGAVDLGTVWIDPKGGAS